MIRPVTTTFNACPVVYSSNILGTWHTIEVGVEDNTLQILFFASPIKTLLVPADVAKLSPFIVKL